MSKDYKIEKMPISSDRNLVVETWNNDEKITIDVYITNEEDNWVQDIVKIEPEYAEKEKKERNKCKSIKVKVFPDAENVEDAEEIEIKFRKQERVYDGKLKWM